MADSELRVQSGQIVVLRLFDVAYEIDLKRAEERCAQRAHSASARVKLVRTPPKAISFGVPPLAIDLGRVDLALNGMAIGASAGVRLYDFGIAAISLRLSAQDIGWTEFSRRVNQINEAVGSASATSVWDMLLAQCCDLVGDALNRPSSLPLQEDYLIAIAHDFDTAITAEGLQQRVDLVPLLSGENRPLSEGARSDLLRHSFSYYPNDLAVITWDRAFLYEPQMGTDVADVLEIANAQLLEMRMYDELLDAELPRVHELMGPARRSTDFLASRRYARLARQLRLLVTEVTELAERVDNALQVTEDVYLARVYAAAMGLFRVPNVSSAVERKLAIIRETYTALHQEAAAARAELLEMIIVVLIAGEIILSLVRH